VFALHLQQGRGQIKAPRPNPRFRLLCRAATSAPPTWDRSSSRNTTVFACRANVLGLARAVGQTAAHQCQERKPSPNCPRSNRTSQNRCLILADGFFEKASASSSRRTVVLQWLLVATGRGGRQVHPVDHHAQRQRFAVSPPDAFILRAEQLGVMWLEMTALEGLENPDRAPLGKNPESGRIVLDHGFHELTRNFSFPNSAFQFLPCHMHLFAVHGRTAEQKNFQLARVGIKFARSPSA